VSVVPEAMHLSSSAAVEVLLRSALSEVSTSGLATQKLQSAFAKAGDTSLAAVVVSGEPVILGVSLTLLHSAHPTRSPTLQPSPLPPTAEPTSSPNSQSQTTLVVIAASLGGGVSLVLGLLLCIYLRRAATALIVKLKISPSLLDDDGIPTKGTAATDDVTPAPTRPETPQDDALAHADADAGADADKAVLAASRSLNHEVSEALLLRAGRLRLQELLEHHAELTSLLTVQPTSVPGPGPSQRLVMSEKRNALAAAAAAGSRWQKLKGVGWASSGRVAPAPVAFKEEEVFHDMESFSWLFPTSPAAGAGAGRLVGSTTGRKNNDGAKSQVSRVHPETDPILEAARLALQAPSQASRRRL